MAGEKERVEGYRFPGDIEVKHCLLVAQDGTIVDISKLALEISVFQSLTEHYLQCEVLMSDATALFNSFEGDRQNGVQGGFNGGEVLVLTYKTRSKDLPFKTHFFGVYEIAERQRLDDKIETYVMNCVSAEAYRTATRKVSRAFGGTGGNLISNMVKTLVDEFVYDQEIKDLHRNYQQVLNVRIAKEVNIDPTNGSQRYVIPNMTVDDTIKFFAKEADNNNHIPYFMFYENSKGFNFKDLNNLVQQEPKERYVYVSTNVKDDNNDSETKIEDYQKIISYTVLRNTNILGNGKAGLFRSKVINLDILKKNKSEYNFRYEKEFSNFNTMQKWKIPGDTPDNGVIYMMQTRIGHDVCCPVFEPENHLPKRINQFIPRRQSYIRHVFNQLMEVSVVGNSELDVGDVINLELPNPTTLGKADKKQDKYLSGNWLITKIRHKFAGDSGSEFTTILECVKDTGIEI